MSIRRVRAGEKGVRKGDHTMSTSKEKERRRMNRRKGRGEGVKAEESEKLCAFRLLCCTIQARATDQISEESDVSAAYHYTALHSSDRH